MKELEHEDYEQELQVNLSIDCNVYVKNEKSRRVRKELLLIRSSPLEGWKVIVEKPLLE